MPRKSRSASFNEATTATTFPQSAAGGGGVIGIRKDSFSSSPLSKSSAVAVPAEAVTACDTLASIILHQTDGVGRTFLHRVASTSSLSSSEDNGSVRLANMLLLRAANIDALVQSRHATPVAVKGGKQHQHQQHKRPNRHLSKMLLTPDEESGYTPLHRAILLGNLRVILLLLRHAALATGQGGDVDNTANHMIDGFRAGLGRVGTSQGQFHPMRALERCEEMTAPTSHSSGTPSSSLSLLDRVVCARDNENLTPLGLLCLSLCNELYKCRESVALCSTFLWRRRKDDVDNGMAPKPRRRRRNRFLSLYDAENLTVVDDDDEENHEEERRQVGRARERNRAGSFGIPDEDLDFIDNVSLRFPEIDEGYDSDGNNPNRNEFAELRMVSDDSQTVLSCSQHDFSDVSSGEDFGCEVLTFGRSDHCALGVPRFTARRDTNTTGKKSLGIAGGSDGAGNARPKRVEAFALGEMGRTFDTGRGSPGPAVAVAAAAHHTLVATRKGHLFAFGLGKGGRLGNGDENHRPLPTRVLGPLVHRRVVAVAAAENHSLCATSDGAVYAWGSNRFGQLGISIGGSEVGASRSLKRTSKQLSQSPKMSASSVRDHQTVVVQRCLPRRVDDLKQKFIVMVAAGDRHSVALSRRGEVFAWGDNRAGQLGMTLQSGCPTGGMGHLPDPHNNTLGKGFHRANRVDALWSASSRRVAIAIAAAEMSTLVLTLPPRSGVQQATAIPVNSVYNWGHGNHSPVKVNFPTAKADVEGSLKGCSVVVKTCVNPTGIACAKYHNAAITADGHVYTWGLHSEHLGTAKKDKSVLCVTSFTQGRETGSSRTLDATRTKPLPTGSMVIASPQLVTGMLPENGGGVAVAVSASENHTAIVTDTGHLFTWGATYGKDVLGHEGVRWQPIPRKVPGVYRAVGLAAAKEHTALLIGTSFPQLPDPEPPSEEIEPGDLFNQPCSLQELAARKVAEYVDIYNVIPVLVTAERINSKPLVDFCGHFIRLNLDGVISLGKSTDMDHYLDEHLSDGTHCFNQSEQDAEHHPLLSMMATAGTTSSLDNDKITSDMSWVDSFEALLRQLPLATVAKHHSLSRDKLYSTACSTRDVCWRRTYSLHEDDTADVNHKERYSCSAERDEVLNCSERCFMMTTNMNLSSPELIQSKFESLTKEVRSVKKKLGRIIELQKSASSHPDAVLTSEQLEKLSRRPLLEADLAVLNPALHEVEQKIRVLNLSEKTTFPVSDTRNDLKTEEKADKREAKFSKKDSGGDEPKTSIKSEVAGYSCDLCSVTCPDDNSYALHMNGRKHRNRMKQAEEKDMMETAASMMENKKRQMAVMGEKNSSVGDISVEPSGKKHETPWRKNQISRKETPITYPRYKLPPPPSLPEPEVKFLKTALVPLSWSSRSPTAEKAGETSVAKISSFQKILEEEEKRVSAESQKVPALVNTKLSPAGKLRAEAATPKASPWSQCSDKSLETKVGAPSTPESSSSLHAFSPQDICSWSSTQPTVSLGSFLKSPPQKTAKKESMQKSSPWEAKHEKNLAGLSQQTPKKVSLHEIQKEEEDFKSREDRMCGVEGKWYVERRERADSLGAIQEQEEKMRLFIEEQRQIEEQIARDLKLQREREQKNSNDLRRNNDKSSGKQHHGGKKKGKKQGGGSHAKKTRSKNSPGKTSHNAAGGRTKEGGV